MPFSISSARSSADPVSRARPDKRRSDAPGACYAGHGRPVRGTSTNAACRRDNPPVPRSSQTQNCSVTGCAEAAAFSTRSAPSWCRAHLEDLFGRTGLRPLEDPPRVKCRILAQCLTCDARASVAFETILEKARLNERQCAACRIGESYPFARPSGLVFSSVASAGRLGIAIAEHAGVSGFEVLQVGTRPRDNLSAAQLQCRTCNIIQIEQFDPRTAALWRCRCAANPKSASRARTGPNLLANSGHAAIEWWDHDRMPS